MDFYIASILRVLSEVSVYRYVKIVNSGYKNNSYFKPKSKIFSNYIKKNHRSSKEKEIDLGSMWYIAVYD